MQIHLRTHNLGARCRAGINPEHPLLRKLSLTAQFRPRRFLIKRARIKDPLPASIMQYKQKKQAPSTTSQAHEKCTAAAAWPIYQGPMRLASRGSRGRDHEAEKSVAATQSS